MNFLVRSKASASAGFFSILLVLSLQTARASSPGALDLTFAGTGVSDRNPGANVQETRAVAVQADGKILMVGKKGETSASSFDFLVARYNANGTIDSSFGTNGVVTTDFNGESDVANAVVVQPDGKILVAGGSENSGGSSPFKMVRYLTDGSLDASFGASGKVYSGFLDYAVSSANMVLQPDGKIVLASDDNFMNLLMARFNSDGSLDAGFGTGGQVVMPNATVYNSIGIQSNGKIIVAGLAFNNTDSVTVYRFNSNGSLDASFGVNGKFNRRYTTFNGFFLEVVQTTLAIQPDDKIIVSGHFHSNSQADYADVLPPLLRLNPDGTADSGFIPNANPNNISLSRCGSCTSEVRKILPLADGRFYAVGFSGDFDRSFRGISISRYNADGSFDNAFGFHGTRYLRKVDWTYSVKGAALQADGKIIVGATGWTNWVETGNIAYHYLVLRLNASVVPTVRGDFDGDRRTDFAVFRPSNRTWYISNSGDNSFSAAFFGASTDAPIPEDYNDDGKTDIATFRASGSTWWIKPSQPGNGIYTTGFGAAGDIPVQADYDGDGFADAAIFRPSTGTWHLRYSSLSLNTAYLAAISFGLSGDKPVPGDYDGDGLADAAVFRPTTGVWWILRSSDNQTMSVQWGISADKPVQADYDGDNKTDVAVFRDGVWYVLRSSDGSFAILQWGLSGDTPAPGDFDGDNRADIAVFRPSEGNWYVYKSSDASFLIVHWGQTDDVPVPSKYLP